MTRVYGMDDGTRTAEIATDEDTAAACPLCGVFSTSVKARVSTIPKDIPYGGTSMPGGRLRTRIIHRGRRCRPLGRRGRRRT